jgi:hypothetical protein
MTAVQQTAYAFEFASDELRGDKEIVLATVKKDKRMLRFGSEELRNDEEFVYELKKLKCLDERYVSDRIREEMKKDENYLVNGLYKREEE